MLSSTHQSGQPTELLEQVRTAGPQGLSDFSYRIALASAAPEPALNPTEAAPPGQPVARANLLAYREIIAFDRTGVVQGLAQNVAQATHQLNEIYTHALRFDVARALLTVYVARWPTARALGVALPIIGDTSGPFDGFRDNKDLDVQIVAKPGATTTFVVCCGLRHAFGVQLNVLYHCSLAKHNTNVVFLRDFSQSLYLPGIRSLGGLRETLKALRKTLASLKTQKLVFIGNSGGVFGALYYGARLHGDLMLLFGGPSSLELGLEETERQAYPRILALHNSSKIAWPNLRVEYSRNKKPVWYYFSSGNRVDRTQAENLQGLANVELRPVPTPHHFMVNEIAETGELEKVLALAAAPLDRTGQGLFNRLKSLIKTRF
jgi:hypothetical protein